jgi:hypothetical protein
MRRSSLSFQFVNLTHLKIEVLWNVTPCVLVNIRRRFGGMTVPSLLGLKSLVGNYLPADKAQHPGRLESVATPL